MDSLTKLATKTIIIYIAI